MPKNKLLLIGICAFLSLASLLVYAWNHDKLSNILISAWSRDSFSPVDSRISILKIDTDTLGALRKRYGINDPEILKLKYTAEAVKALAQMSPKAIGINYLFNSRPTREDSLLDPLVSGKPPVIFSVNGSWPIEGKPASGPAGGKLVGYAHSFMNEDNTGLHDFYRGRSAEPSIPFYDRTNPGIPPPFVFRLYQAAEGNRGASYAPYLEKKYLLPVRFWTKQSVAENVKNDPERLFVMIKLEDFLESPEKLRKYCEGKIVLLGETGLDPIRDDYRTPVGSGIPNVIVTANALRMLMDKAFIRKLPEKFLLFLILISGIVAAWLALHFTKGILLPLAFIILLVFASYELGEFIFVRCNFFLDLSGIYLSVFPGVIFVSAYKLYVSEHERKKIKSALDLYVGQEVLGEFLAARNLLAPQGSRKQVTILFVDIRNFTAFVEKSGAEAALSQLRDFFGSVASQVTEFGGFINKFLGDGFMAIFGVTNDEGHAAKAVKSAFAMLVALEKQNEAWEERNMERLEIGIGIDSGEVIWGNIGVAGKMEFTVTGDPVNTASRIEGMTKAHPDYPVLLSGTTRDLLKEGDLWFQLDYVGEVSIRGKTAQTRLFGIPRKATR